MQTRDITFFVLSVALCVCLQTPFKIDVVLVIVANTWWRRHVSLLTVLHAAARRGNAKLLRFLLTYTDVNPNGMTEWIQYESSLRRTTSTKTALFRAALHGHADCVAALLAHADIDPNTATKQRVTPLYIAASKNHVTCVTLLLQHARIEPNGDNPPLHTTLENGCKASTAALLRHAKIKPTTDAVLLAARWEDVHALQLLLDHPNVHTDSFVHVLHALLIFNDDGKLTPVLKLLIDHKRVDVLDAYPYAFGELADAIRLRKKYLA